MSAIDLNRKFLIKELKETLIIFLIGVPWGFLMCGECGNLMASIVISGVIWVLLAKGNGYISDLASKKVSWINAPFTRLALGLVLHVVYTVLIMLALVYILELFFDIHFSNIYETIRNAVIITLLITLVLTSKDFLYSWRQLAVDNERVKKEAATAKYESLRNQVNPHFLFNSFNVLTDLVYEDQDLAAKFIKKLSEVYRYVLEVKDKELVPLKEEVEFINSYVFLLKIRHGDALQFSNDLSTEESVSIAPMSLQMLVENCIKHNVVSEEDPLKITIDNVGEYLRVTNNLQLRAMLPQYKSGIGLKNIKARYKFLSNKQVKIEKTEDQFTVLIPLISEQI